MRSQEITARLVIADQPEQEELGLLAGQGYRAVVNLRRDGEPEQPLSTAEEGRLARAAGLDYLHLPVGGVPLSQSDLDVLNAFLDTHADEKVLVHCRKGGRAAALAVLHLASKEGWPAEEIPARGRELGLNLDPGLLRLISPFLQPTKD